MMYGEEVESEDPESKRAVADTGVTSLGSLVATAISVVDGTSDTF